VKEKSSVVIGVEISVFSMLSKYENMRARGSKNKLRKQFIFTLLFSFFLTLILLILIHVMDKKSGSKLKYNFKKLKPCCYNKKLIN